MARAIAWDSSWCSARSSASMRAFSARSPAIRRGRSRHRDCTRGSPCGAASASLVLPGSGLFLQAGRPWLRSAICRPGCRTRRAVPSFLVLCLRLPVPARPACAGVVRPWSRRGLVAQRPRQCKRMALQRPSGGSRHALGRVGCTGSAGRRPDLFFQAPPRSGGGSDDIGDAAVAAGRRRGVEGVAKPKPSTILRPKGLAAVCSNEVLLRQVYKSTTCP